MFWLTRWQLRLPVSPEQKIPLLLSLYWLAPLLIWAYVHWGENTSLASYGIAWSAAFGTSVIWGFVLGVGGIGLLLLLKRSLGWLSFSIEVSAGDQNRFQPLGTWLKSAVPILALALLISWVEEIVFRGFVVTQLHLAYDWVTVVAVASFLFAILHLVWEGLAGIPQLPGLALMGAVLILARWADGGLLGLPTGLHAGWIFTLALTDTLKLVAPREKGPRWLTGRSDQPLTSLIDIALLLVTAGLLWLYGSYQ